MSEIKLTMPVPAWEALCRAWAEARGKGKSMDDALMAAFSAAINAWPGMHEARSDRLGCQIIILPLPKEASDD